MNQQPQTPSSEIPGEDRLWVLLCFLITPLLPIITLVMEDKKNRPFIKYHTIPTLVLGLAEWILIVLFSLIPIIGGVAVLVYLVNIYYGLKANKGEYTEIPYVTNFAKSQGWM